MLFGHPQATSRTKRPCGSALVLQWSTMDFPFHKIAGGVLAKAPIETLEVWHEFPAPVIVSSDILKTDIRVQN